jgi:hypothetical protein
MKKKLLLVGVFITGTQIAFGSLDTGGIDAITGLKGKLNEKEGVYRVTFPRNDVKVSVDVTHEEPRIMFFHYWGRGPAKDLANAIKDALLARGLLKASSPL